MADTIASFSDFCAALGMTPPQIVADGKLHRFRPIEDGRKSRKPGWYVLHDDDYPQGVVCDWRTGDKHFWKDERVIGRSSPRADLREVMAKRAAERQAQREAGIASARERWEKAQRLNGHGHPYLDRKAVSAVMARVDGDAFLLPCYGPDKRIQTVQAIFPDGSKRFHAGAPASGSYLPLGTGLSKLAAGDRVYLCEGYATAATVFEATSTPTICCFDGANMVAVAKWLGPKYPDLEYVVAADDDRFTEGNPGASYADQVRTLLLAPVMTPVFQDRSRGTDFNDMAADYGLDAVRDLLQDGILPSGDQADVIEAPEPDTFPLLSLDDLENLPAPTWLIDTVIPQHGLTVVYGEPGAGKSFVVLDMALRAAYGMDWHGRTAKHVGVLYVAGEGRYGLAQRVKGWRRHHDLTSAQAPFLLQPVAVPMLDKDGIEKLVRTIDHIKRSVGFDIGLTIVDTVSRAIAGQDENSQESMSLFVDACAKVQDHTGGALIGVHHSGKDKDRGMRGSTVLLGACDAAIRLDKDNGFVALRIEKQKDGEQIPDVRLSLQKIEWASGLQAEQTTLVPVLPSEASNAMTGQRAPFSRQNIRRIFDEIESAWFKKKPWSVVPQTRQRGRYLPAWMHQEFGCPEKVALDYLGSWQMNGMLAMDEADSNSKARGLRVLRRMED